MEPVEATVQLATDSERQQFDFLVRAFEIFKDRTRARGDLWTQFSEPDALYHMKSKVARLDAALKMITEGARGKDELESDMVDNALDIVNYAVFFCRHVEQEYPATDTTVHHG